MEQELRFCGMAVNEIGDITAVCCRGEGEFLELMFLEAYGSAMSISGMEGIEVAPVDTYTQEGLEIYQYMKDALMTGSRGEAQMIVRIKEGFLVITQIEPTFMANIQSLRIGDAEPILYTGGAEACEFEEGDDPAYGLLFEMTECF